MAYGITSSSQLVDLDTIRSGCEQFKKALEDFKSCGKAVIAAGETCSKKALSIDENSLEFSITDLGTEIKSLKDVYSAYADQLMAEAIQVYNAQVNELNEYIRQQEAEKQRQQNNS